MSDENELDEPKQEYGQEHGQEPGVASEHRCAQLYHQEARTIYGMDADSLEEELAKLKDFKCVKPKVDETETEFTLELPIIRQGGPMQSPYEPATEYTMTASAWDYLNSGISLIHNWRKVNPRTPWLKTDSDVRKLKTSGPVKDMRAMLEHTPYLFGLANNGITLSAAELIPNGGTIATIRFTDRNHQGILNGLTTSAVLASFYNDATERLVAARTDYQERRHRMTALKQFQLWRLRLSMARVSIKLVMLDDNQFIRPIAKGLNTSVQVRPRDMEYQSGLLTDLENAVKQLGLSNRYEFKSGEGAKSSTSVDELITVILLVAATSTPSLGASSVYGNASKNLDKYKRLQATNPTLYDALHLPDRLRDMLGIYDDTAEALANRLSNDLDIAPTLKRIASAQFMDTTKRSGKYRARKQHIVPIVASFGANLNSDGSWKLPLEDVSNRIIEAGIDKLYDNIIAEIQAEGLIARPGEGYYNACAQVANNVIRDVEIEQGIRPAPTPPTKSKKS